MTSGERHEKRYHNRLKRRQELKNNFLTSLPTYDELFTFDNLFDAFYKCRTNVRWKESIQRYEANLYTNTYDLFKQLENRTFKSKGFHTFVINERGKQRWIRSVHISERIVQKVLCDNYLVPLLSHYLIYDNGATLKGKGTDFTLKRLNLHLHKYYREFNINKGYILIYDFSDYFGSINQGFRFLKKDTVLTDSGKVVMSLCNKSITNERRRLIAYKKMFEYGKIGMDIILQSYKSWRGWAIKFDNNRSVHNMDMLFIELFGEYIKPDDLSFKSKPTNTKPQPIRRRCCYDR